MSKRLTDSAAELLADLVRVERIDVTRGYTVYPDRGDILEIIDEAERALAGDAGFTTSAINLIIDLAREERRAIYSGQVSYGPAEGHNAAVAEELTNAIEALRTTVTAVTA